jgi:hypothetical protein
MKKNYFLFLLLSALAENEQIRTAIAQIARESMPEPEPQPELPRHRPISGNSAPGAI